MSVVTLVSGGLDSSLMAAMTGREGIVQFPLFVDYGQKSVAREWSACRSTLRRLGAPPPHRMRLQGYGRTIKSGLTDPKMDVFKEAFLPGRNLLFLMCGAAYAVQNRADGVLIGLLNESTHLFPDQTRNFLSNAKMTLAIAMGRDLEIVAPLMHMMKGEVIELAKKYEVSGTYSCHRGSLRPCGTCISCREFLSAKA